MFDLGYSHSLSWIMNNNKRIGAMIDHIKSDNKLCWGTLFWEGDEAHWEILGETDENITLSPSVLCDICGDHGYIKNGKWEPI